MPRKVARITERIYCLIVLERSQGESNSPCTLPNSAPVGPAGMATATGNCKIAISMARRLCETRTPRAQTTPARQKLQAKALRVQTPKALRTTHASKNGYGDADVAYSMGYRMCYLLWCCRYGIQNGISHVLRTTQNACPSDQSGTMPINYV